MSKADKANELKKRHQVLCLCKFVKKDGKTVKEFKEIEVLEREVSLTDKQVERFNENVKTNAENGRQCILWKDGKRPVAKENKAEQKTDEKK